MYERIKLHGHVPIRGHPVYLALLLTRTRLCRLRRLFGLHRTIVLSPRLCAPHEPPRCKVGICQYYPRLPFATLKLYSWLHRQDCGLGHKTLLSAYATMESESSNRVCVNLFINKILVPVPEFLYTLSRAIHASCEDCAFSTYAY